MESGAGEGSSSMFSTADDDESLKSTTDADLLKRAWRTEKTAPEILHIEANLVQRSLEQIQLMVSSPITNPNLSLCVSQFDFGTMFMHICVNMSACIYRSQSVILMWSNGSVNV